jgi:formylglycine-generating enzyme required for sulfatase activity
MGEKPTGKKLDFHTHNYLWGMKKKLSAAFLFIWTAAAANNVQLANISVSNNITNTGKVIQFDLSWENSWRTSSTGNYDGVWVFFKFKDLTGNWYHLNFTGANITMPAGASYDIGNNSGAAGIGMFIYRTANGAGNVNLTNVRAGITSYPGTFEVRGFAIEMVYVPQGSFYIGDGSSSNAFASGGTSNPFQVTGTTLTIGTATGNLEDPLIGSFSGTLNNFPTGYNDYWMMKYELSQGAYRDFLNTLTKTQQITRMQVNPESTAGSFIQGSSSLLHKCYLQIDTPATANTPAKIRCYNNDSVSYEWNPVALLTWNDAAAYLDWAGLRPMTELEYEKACRGPLAAVNNEYAWGNTSINDWNTIINGTPENYVSFLNTGKINETAANSSAVTGNGTYGSNLNACGGFCFTWANLIRGGGFASAFSTRVSSGAGYYGAMELSGNAMELAITLANAAGRAFTGKHGDGILTTQGNADENNWPGVNGATGTNTAPGTYSGGAGVTSDGGIIRKGGSFTTTATELLVSRRNGTGTGTVNGNTLPSSLYGYGIRGVRNAN